MSSAERGPEPGASRQDGATTTSISSNSTITCASGTDALLMPLMARGIGPGDAVFTPAFTFYATAEVAALVGATPVLVDVEEGSFNLDPRSLARARWSERWR